MCQHHLITWELDPWMLRTRAPWRRSIHTWLKPRVRTYPPMPLDKSSSSSPAPRRVVSLLPSATEQFASIIAEAEQLGHTTLPTLVGRSHECDYPAAYASVPVLTKPRTTFTTCEDTHNEVLTLLQNEDSLYEIDAAQLTALAPDLILVQDVCKVCSIDRPSVSCAMADSDTQILLVNSRTLANALEDSIRLLGQALQLEAAAEAVIAANRAREAALTVPSPPRRPIVYIVEWMEPLFLAKGWADEMVALAGGQAPSETGRIQNLSALAPPDIIVVALCGLDRHVSIKELLSKPFPSWWSTSPAVRHNRVFVADGNQMFNRPTNRLLDALAWLGRVVAAPDSTDIDDLEFPADRFLCDGSVATTEPSAKEAAIQRAHAAACAAKEARYTDPETGYGVFTSYFLSERQACCGNKCRHCPYGHAMVPIERLGDTTPNALTSSVFLKAPKPTAVGRLGYKNPKRVPGGAAVVVFWSGGKDSLLALYETIQRLDEGHNIVLLTTFNPDDGVVPIQNIDTRSIVAQAAVLNLPLFLVAVPTGASYSAVVHAALAELPGVRMPHIATIAALVVGDLHLEDVNAWRVAEFADYNMQSPLWRRGMQDDLLPLLARLCADYRIRVTYSAVDAAKLPQIHEGDAYDPARVPNDVDVMGENGEFHTVVHFDK
ncbi:Aste57867_3979 [Aphanomyces stellatus]|uniref:Diphthine--ammonia ligase n=1 Tax=Aphanomyces stellatus TaxID=120398 RepID=A0A485KBN7_9STRA|nr:hypothetical protein As57867_003968 [Aphanomyces stellatus]VFT81116.1 Aste57867_3979 [Aphanomyces stellatus]